jgi:hypothetical protein
MRIRALLSILASTLLVAMGAASAFAAVQPEPARACPQPNGRVSTMAISGGTLYLGGDFSSVEDESGVSRTRRGLAAVDVATCRLLPWTAATDAEVIAMVVSGDTVYIGGSFLSVGGLNRSRIAALDASTAAVRPWSPVMNKPVRALVASDTTVYAGGEFAKVGATKRSKLAAFSLSSGALDTTWQPTADAKVNALALSADGGRVYVGGAFQSLNGLTGYPYLGAVDPATGDVDTTFAPHALAKILALRADSRALYAGQAGSGGHLVIWNTDGTLQRPIYQTDGDVQTVAVDGDSVFAGGHFTNYCVGNTGSGAPFKCDVNLERRKLFEVSLTSGEVTPWAPALDSPFGAISSVVDPVTHDLWVGGDFTQVSGQPVAHLARFVTS